MPRPGIIALCERRIGQEIKGGQVRGEVAVPVPLLVRRVPRPLVDDALVHAGMSAVARLLASIARPECASSYFRRSALSVSFVRVGDADRWVVARLLVP